MTSSALYQREYRKRQIEKDSEKYYSKCREIDRRRYSSAKRRAYTLKSQYGLTPESWEELFDSQERKCAICKSDKPRGKHNKWYTDHNHVTGKLRGILCHNCNVGLGNFKSDEGTQTMFDAIKYINKYDGEVH